MSDIQLCTGQYSNQKATGHDTGQYPDTGIEKREFKGFSHRLKSSSVPIIPFTANTFMAT
jgi:hypothetical protein